jgi:ABC-type Mn2+/Zn2+ transport system ATPase subunit
MPFTQARLLLASALIQYPDVLLLGSLLPSLLLRFLLHSRPLSDEPTTNLDVAGAAHLTRFLQVLSLFSLDA